MTVDTFEAMLLITETDKIKALDKISSEVKRIMQKLSEEDLISEKDFEEKLTKWVEWVFREQKRKTDEGFYIIEEFSLDEDREEEIWFMHYCIELMDWEELIEENWRIPKMSEIYFSHFLYKWLEYDKPPRDALIVRAKENYERED